jgi:hypothetical protein
MTPADRIIADAVAAVIAGAADDQLPIAIRAAADRAAAAAEQVETPREIAAHIVAAILAALPAATAVTGRQAASNLRRDGWHITALPLTNHTSEQR